MPRCAGPTVKKDPRPHRTAIHAAGASQIKLDMAINDHDPGDLAHLLYRCRYYKQDITMEVSKADQARDSAEWKDSRTWTGALWKLRGPEMDATQKAKDNHVERYRPIQTLDGLDPHWQRKYFREITGSVVAWRKMMKEMNYG